MLYLHVWDLQSGEDKWTEAWLHKHEVRKIGSRHLVKLRELEVTHYTLP